MIPELFDREPTDEPLRIWSVGCATGEEAYSLAMLIVEEAERRDWSRPVQVFASDLHERSLKRAREGFYPGDIQTDVSHERLQRHFTSENGGYRVRKKVRELVVFSPHNLLSDPPFSRLDLVVCRNLLIYLQRDIQPDVMGLFHYALKPDGLLVLGSAEALDSSDLFSVENKAACLYRRRNVAASEPRLPVFPLHHRSELKTAGPPDESYVEPVDFGKLHHRLTERYAPPSVLIDSDNRIIHLSAQAGRFLYHPGGEVTSSIFQLVREELQLELRAVVAEARERREEVTGEPILVHFESEVHTVIIRVRPATEIDHKAYLLILFDEQPRATVSPPDSHDEPEPQTDRDRERIRLLSSELDHSHQRVRKVVEEYETSREELRSSNEELQSSNEELGSTLEELETSKEELQSMYEELQTVNQENRHKVEELSQLSSDLQNLLAAIDIATLFLDREFRILRFTPKVGELFNFRMTDRGRHLSDFTHRLGYPELLDDAKQVLNKLIPIEREAQDEQGRWFLTRVLPYRDSNERIAGVVITCIDISSRKRAELALRASEERFRIATDAVNGVIYEHDLESGRVQWTSGLPKVSGYELDEAGTSIQWWWERVHPDDRPVVDRDYLAGNKVEREFRLRHKAGHWVHLWDQAMVVPNASGQPTSVIGCAVDITAQREFEESLKKSQATAEAANRSRGEFLANMSHEIRNPMTAILGHADILYERLDDPDNLHCLDIISRNGHFLLEVINDILDLSKIDAGHMVVARKPARLAEIVGDAISLMGVRAREKRLSLNIEFEGLLPEYIETDVVRLRQVLLNVLSNAIKFTDQGSVRLIVRADDQQNRLVFAVVDTGIGISEEKLSQIFDPFTQADTSATRPFEGTGLGLAISRRLAQALGGELSVETTLGEGSTFYLSIDPGNLASARRTHLKFEESPQSNNTERSESIRGTILLVDDRDDIRFLAQRLIERAGGAVVTAANGHEALSVVAGERGEAIDLVVMDMHMPEMDGYEATRQLRARGFNKPIIALTANAMVGDRHECLQAGYNDYVAKPIDSATFVSKIARKLNTSNQTAMQL